LGVNGHLSTIDPALVRVRGLNVREVHLGRPFGRVQAIEGILRRNGWQWREVAHLGDDLAGLPLLDARGQWEDHVERNVRRGRVGDGG